MGDSAEQVAFESKYNSLNSLLAQMKTQSNQFFDFDIESEKVFKVCKCLKNQSKEEVFKKQFTIIYWIHKFAYNMNLKGKICPMPPNGPGFRSAAKDHLNIRNQISEFVEAMSYPNSLKDNQEAYQNLKTKLTTIQKDFSAFSAKN